MRIADLFENEALTEGLSRVSVTEVWDRVTKAVERWVRDTMPRAKSALVPGMMEDLDALEAERRRLETEEGWQAGARLTNRISNLRDDINGRFKSGIVEQRFGLDSFKAMIEHELQEIAREHIERTFGKIEPMERGKDYDTQRSKHLYWLQHIVVTLRMGALNKKTGREKTGGGYFAKWLPSNDDFDTLYYRDNVDKMQDLGVGIALFAAEKDVLKLIRNLLTNELQEEVYGEPMLGDELPAWLQDTLDTYVHEVAHLEQDVRRQLSSRAAGRYPRDHGISYTPAPKDRKASEYRGNEKPLKRGPDTEKNRKASSRSYMAGKRGNPDRLSDDDFSDPVRLTDYYGTAHEIEAHAAGAAANIVSAFKREEASRRRRYRDVTDDQLRLNEFIDSSVSDLKSGYWPEHHSVRQMLTLMRDKIVPADGKADIGHRKVWRIFMTKLIRYLMSFRKDVEWTDPEDWRRGEAPQPRASKAGDITFPARQPKLP